MEWKYDKVYSSKHEMMQAIENEKSDGVYIGRYVLVNYGNNVGSSIEQLQTISSLEEFNNYSRSESGILFYAASEFNTTTGQAFTVYPGDLLITGNSNAPAIDSSGNYWTLIRSNDLINQNKALDKYFYSDDTRTWHNTIWQKVINNNSQEDYLFIADLNLLQNTSPNKILITDENNQVVLADNDENDLIYSDGIRVLHGKSNSGNKYAITGTSESGTVNGEATDLYTSLTIPQFTIDNKGHVVSVDNGTAFNLQVNSSRDGICAQEIEVFSGLEILNEYFYADVITANKTGTTLIQLSNLKYYDETLVTPPSFSSFIRNGVKYLGVCMQGPDSQFFLVNAPGTLAENQSSFLTNEAFPVDAETISSNLHPGRLPEYLDRTCPIRLIKRTEEKNRLSTSNKYIGISLLGDSLQSQQIEELAGLNSVINFNTTNGSIEVSSKNSNDNQFSTQIFGAGSNGIGLNSETHNNNQKSCAEGSFSTCFGVNTKAGNYASFSQGEGGGSVTIGDGPFSLGAYGPRSHVEGMNCHAIGFNAHAEGYWTTAQGHDSHSQGYRTLAQGAQSQAGGSKGYALGDRSFSFGEGEPLIITNLTKLTDNNGNPYLYVSKNSVTNYTSDYLRRAFILYDNKLYQFIPDRVDVVTSLASSFYWKSSTSGAEFLKDVHTNTPISIANWTDGTVCSLVLPLIAVGNNSVTFGSNNIALGRQSMAVGRNNIAYFDDSFVCGRNCSNSDYNKQNNLFVVGNGTSASSLSNAFRVNEKGNCYALKSCNNTGADYAEYFKWQNIPQQKLQSLFVTLDEDKIRLATKEDDYILGIISTNPGVIGNSPIDEDRENDPEYAVVGLMGQIVVEDDGTCKPNKYCYPGENGVATASETGYRVMKRIDDNHVLVMFR